MPQSLSTLEATRSTLLQQIITIGDYRPGTVSVAFRKCGKSTCHCAQPDSTGHQQFRILRKVTKESVSESFSSPAAFEQAAEQVSEYHRLQRLLSELGAVNEHICRLRPIQTTPVGWSEEEKKRLLLFFKKLQERSKPFAK